MNLFLVLVTKNEWKKNDEIILFKKYTIHTATYSDISSLTAQRNYVSVSKIIQLTTKILSVLRLRGVNRSIKVCPM